MAKVLIPGTKWQGSLIQHIGEAFKACGNETDYIYYEQNQPFIYKALRLNQLISVNKKLADRDVENYNNQVRDYFIHAKADIVYTLSGGRLYPDTVEYIRKCGCTTVTFVADNPFDSSRDKYYAMSLQHYDYIFVAEKWWLDSIKKIAPKSQIIKSMVGYNPEMFYPIEKSDITETDFEKYQCDVSFTGANYGEGAEGAYRAGILNHLSEFDLRIWGYGNWPFRFKYYPHLQKAFKGDSLSWDDLRKLYTLSQVNLNLPSPQVFTGIQPRIFDIAATKGFQIIDYREELWDYFTEEEIVTFKTIPELLDKIRYFINNPNDKLVYIENLYQKIKDNFTWKQKIEETLQIINSKE